MKFVRAAVIEFAKDEEKVKKLLYESGPYRFCFISKIPELVAAKKIPSVTKIEASYEYGIARARVEEWWPDLTGKLFEEIIRCVIVLEAVAGMMTD